LQPSGDAPKKCDSAMIENDTERDIPPADAEGPVGEYSMRTVLLILCLAILVIGGTAAWYFELGVSSQAKRERFVTFARESLGRDKVHEAIIALDSVLIY
jgi:hypothetical protein